MDWNCTNCGRLLHTRSLKHLVKNEMGEDVPVGSNCVKKIREAGTSGYFSENLGGFLFSQAAFAAEREEFNGI